MTALNFNARNVAPDSGMPDPVPSGWYNVMMDQSESKPTSTGNGSFLECRFNILDGQYAGRKLFHRLNLQNPNAKAVEIAYGQLSAICHAVNVMDVPDSQVLHGIPLKVKVALRAGGPKMDKQTGQPTGEVYEPSNEIKQFANINDPSAGNAAPAGPAAGAPTGYTPPAFQPPAQQPAQQWQQPAQQPAQPFGQPAAQPQQFAQQPQQPAGTPWQGQPQQPAQGVPAQGVPAQPWQGQPQQPAGMPAQPQGLPQQPQGAPSQPWQGAQQPAQQPQQFTQQPQQPAAAGGFVPPWQQPRQ